MADVRRPDMESEEVCLADGVLRTLDLNEYCGLCAQHSCFHLLNINGCQALAPLASLAAFDSCAEALVRL